MTKQQNPGAKAREALDKIKSLMKTGRISYGAAREFAEPFLETLNKESAKISRAHGMTPRKTGFTSYMR